MSDNSATNLFIRGFPDKPLNVSLKTHGSKNCALPIILYCFLLEGENSVTIRNVPNISDVVLAVRALKEMGGDAEYYPEEEKLVVRTGIRSDTIPDFFVRETRISVLLMSIVVSKFWKVKFPISAGGCHLWGREIDFHLDAFRSFGCSVTEFDDGYGIDWTARHVGVPEYAFPKPSTTGTENAIILGCALDEGSVIKNAHLRPEILDFIRFVNELWANVSHDGTDVRTRYSEVPKNKVLDYRIIDDLEEAMSKVSLLIITGNSGKVSYENPYEYAEIEKLLDISGHLVSRDDGGFYVNPSAWSDKIGHVHIETGPFPWFGSDNQPIFAWLLLFLAESFSIRDDRFKARFTYAENMKKFGVPLTVENNRLHVTSGNVSPETGDGMVELFGHDLRSAINAVLLAARYRKKTRISNAQLLLRGYSDIFDTLKTVGIDFAYETAYD